MKISLSEKQTFWGLSHPINYDKMVIWLTPDEPVAEIDYEKSPSWMQAMIKNSVLAKRIMADPNPLIEEKNEKKITKRKGKKKVKTQKEKNE